MKSKTYEEFVEKFKPKKTTDDCYTPDDVYTTIRDYFVDYFHLEGRKIVRPFYPGGDYEHYEYPKGCVVLDNPPFSIITNICRFYKKNGIDFLLFAPALTLCDIASGDMNYIVDNTKITYLNGAIVSTSFVTNMGNYKLVGIGQDLSNAIMKLPSQKKNKVNRQKYDNPVNVFSLSIYSNSFLKFQIPAENCHFIRKVGNIPLYGGGFLIDTETGTRLQDEKKRLKDETKIIVRKLSPEQQKIVEQLDNNKKERKNEE